MEGLDRKREESGKASGAGRGAQAGRTCSKLMEGHRSKGKNKGTTEAAGTELVWRAACRTELSLAAGPESKAMLGRWGVGET